MASRRQISLVLISVLLTTMAGAWAVYHGLFAPPTLYETDAHPLDVAVGDINGDGHTDVLTANRDGRSVSIFLGAGDGALMPLAALDTGLGATSLTLTNLDDDPNPDLVVTGCTPGCQSNEILFYAGDGEGRFRALGSLPSTGVPYNVATADLDGDGVADFAASDYPGDRLLVLLSGAEGGPRERFLPTGDKPIALEVGDVNGDGRPDLVSSDHGSGGSTVHLSLGGGEFDEPVQVATGDLPYSIALAHLDGDGFLDLAVAHSTGEGTISIWQGTGHGTFDFRQEIPVDGTPVYIDTADFDADGSPDLIITRQDESFAGVFFNESDGLFDEREVRVQAANRIYSLAVTDLDGDPYPDLVTVDYAQSTVSVSTGQPLTRN